MASSLIDIHVVSASQLLMDAVKEELREQLYRFILMDWRIWYRCSYPVRASECYIIPLLSYRTWANYGRYYSTNMDDWKIHVALYCLKSSISRQQLNINYIRIYFTQKTITMTITSYCIIILEWKYSANLDARERLTVTGLLTYSETNAGRRH